eukprot:1767313-Pyramimonas_sp.AAC.2
MVRKHADSFNLFKREFRAVERLKLQEEAFLPELVMERPRKQIPPVPHTGNPLVGRGGMAKEISRPLSGIPKHVATRTSRKDLSR